MKHEKSKKIIVVTSKLIVHSVIQRMIVEYRWIHCIHEEEWRWYQDCQGKSTEATLFVHREALYSLFTAEAVEEDNC